VDVDANMVHGWPLLSAALTARVLLWGTICHHVKREASRFIPSILFLRDRLRQDGAEHRTHLLDHAGVHGLEMMN
jgi:hypothetical protein